MASGFPRGRDQRNRVHQPVQPCRDCARRMLWVTMPSGKRNPLDLDPPAEPTDAPANVIVVDREDSAGDRWRLGVVLHDRELIAEAVALGFTVHTSHFATCPARKPALRERADLA